MDRLILAGGTVRTMDRARPVAQAIAVRGGVVVGLDVRAETGEAVDLRGRCVLPGFTDAHVHSVMWATGLRRVRLEGAQSVGEAVARVRDAAAGLADGRWLLGRGWRVGQGELPQEPTRADLDAVVAGVPVALDSRDGHSLWLNSAALARAGEALAGCGEVVERDPSGEPTGILREEAIARFKEHVVEDAPGEAEDAVRAAIPVLHAAGVTALHDKDGGLGALAIWRRLHAEAGGALGLRVWQSLPHDRLDALEAIGLPPGLGDATLRAGYLKVFMDGALGSRTTALLDGSGVVVTTRAELEEIVRRGAALGWPIGVHAIGDRANRDALDAFEATAPLWRPLGLRHRIEHAQLVHPDDLGRFAALGVAASVQFSHAISDRDLVEEVWGAGESLAYPFRALSDAGALLVNGSDAPVEALDPLLGVRSAVARTWDERPPWRPEQGVDVQTALEASTCNAAWLSGDEQRRGRLVPGQLADLVVLDRDPLACPPDELGELRVEATMAGGRWVHGAPPWD